jgi:hypothetical protein
MYVRLHSTDIFITNIGIFGRMDFADITDEDWM